MQMTPEIRSRWGYPALLFTALVALLFTWAVATPLFASPDEPAHLYKAYGTAHGQLLGDVEPGFESTIRLFDAPAEMGTPDLRCYFGFPERSAACAVGSDGKALSTAALYPPPWYAAVGIPPRLIGQSTSQRAYRMTAAALCAAIIAIAFESARRTRSRHLSPLLFIGLTPMTLFLAGSVNPNAFEIAVFLLIWVLCMHHGSARAPTLRTGVLIGSLVGAVLISRFASAISVACGVVVIAALLGVDHIRRVASKRFLAGAIGCSIFAVTLLMWWAAYADVTVVDRRVASDIGMVEAARQTARSLPGLAEQMIGVLGWLDTMLPPAVYWLFGLFTALIVAGVVLARDRRLTIATALTFAGLLASPIVVNMISAATAGLIWQGRYSLPLFALLGPLGMLAWQQVIDRRPLATPRLATSLRFTACGLFAIAEVVGFWQMLRRFTVGAHGKIWLTDPLPWRPAVAPMVLIAGNIVLVTLVCVTVLRATRQPAPVSTPG